MPATDSDSLRAYRRKRSADRTPEPFGGKRSASGQIFVVQQHAARRLHYDFRLEIEGVLKSWAVPKGPSPNPADKRLAVRTEDHPLEYADFEGRIPEGNYGAGAVIIWDRGRWIPLNDPEEGLDKGKLLFELKGYKLRGKWTLVRTKQDWLLIKEHDSYVQEEGTESYPADSILSGQTVAELAADLDPAEPVLERLEALEAPRRTVSARQTQVMLAQPGTPFSKAGWLFEFKYDGYRLLAAREGESTTLYSRTGNDLTATFPEIATVVGTLPYERLILDGEVVVHDEQGLPSFSHLQRRAGLRRRVDAQRATVELPATYYVFDLLAFDGYDVRPLPLVERKALLRELIPTAGPIRYSDHIVEQGELMYDHVRDMGLEGVVAKQADSRYRAGRSPHWVKISIRVTDDFAVMGYTEPKGSQTGFGALLVGQYEGDTLLHMGRVGSGFNQADLKRVGALLRKARPADAPADVKDERDYHWTEPLLVCEVTFKEITPDGLLRQPVFLRWREDKESTECVRRAPRTELPEPAAIVPDEREERVVHFTNLDKVFWPEEGYTKGDLIEYHRAIAPWLLPYLRDRPLVLTRYPDGIDGKFFFQKDAPGFAPDWMRIEVMWSEGAEREVRYFVVEDVESLLYIANMGTIPLHIWSSRVATLERPDWTILDLDPKGAPFADVVEIALAIRSLCDDIELPCAVKTSGSTGLHVLIPLGRQCSYEESRSLAELLARVVVAELPDIATIQRVVSEREGRVYVDYLQNGHGRLLVAPFCARPLPGAPVSMPLRWREVNKRLDIHRYTIRNAPRRMRSLATDPLREVIELQPELGNALDKLRRRFA